MKQILSAALLIIAACAFTFAQESQRKPNPPLKSLAETLKAAGNFQTFLSLPEQAGPMNLGLVPTDGKISPAQVGPGGGPHYQTVFVPTDAAFTRLPQDALNALKQRLRAAVLFPARAHRFGEGDDRGLAYTCRRQHRPDFQRTEVERGTRPRLPV